MESRMLHPRVAGGNERLYSILVAAALAMIVVSALGMAIVTGLF
jgi:hypothetical protein